MHCIQRYFANKFFNCICDVLSCGCALCKNDKEYTLSFLAAEGLILDFDQVKFLEICNCATRSRACFTG